MRFPLTGGMRTSGTSMDYAVIKTLHSIYVRGLTSLLPCLSPQHRETWPLAKVGSRLFSQLALILLGMLLEFPKGGKRARGIRSFSWVKSWANQPGDRGRESEGDRKKAKGQGRDKEGGKMGGTVRKDSRDSTQEGTGESNISETVFSGKQKGIHTHGKFTLWQVWWLILCVNWTGPQDA